MKTAVEGITLALILAGLAAHTANLEAATFVVSPGAMTVQNAMVQAAPGDSVVLQPGTYFLAEGILLRGGVTLTSTMGAQATILEMGYQFPGIVAQDLTIPAIVDGIAFFHGHGPTAYPVGGGILSLYSATIVRNCLFIANDATDFEGGGGAGGAIGIVGGSSTIEHNTIVGNVSGDGAVSLYSTRATVRDNVIAYNRLGISQPYGYGIACYDDLGSMISNNLLWANEPGDLEAGCLGLSDGNHFVDPKFCAPVMFPQDAAVRGDWRTGLNSPLAPGGSLTGIGLFLGLCDAVPTKTTSWGWVKATYR